MFGNLLAQTLTLTVGVHCTVCPFKAFKNVSLADPLLPAQNLYPLGSQHEIHSTCCGHYKYSFRAGILHPTSTNWSLFESDGWRSLFESDGWQKLYVQILVSRCGEEGSTDVQQLLTGSYFWGSGVGSTRRDSIPDSPRIEATVQESIFGVYNPKSFQDLPLPAPFDGISNFLFEKNQNLWEKESIQDPDDHDKLFEYLWRKYKFCLKNENTLKSQCLLSMQENLHLYKKQELAQILPDTLFNRLYF